jgi:hypothetical protein
LLKEAAASRQGITSLDASIEDLFGLRHRAKRANLVHCHPMTSNEAGVKLILIAEDENILRLPSKKGDRRPRKKCLTGRKIGEATEDAGNYVERNQPSQQLQISVVPRYRLPETNSPNTSCLYKKQLDVFSPFANISFKRNLNTIEKGCFCYNRT